MSIQAIILAAGQGKRMYSKLPKVLHCLAGMPLLARVLKTASSLTDKSPIVVYGHEGQQLKQALSNHKITWVEQSERLGTGHAVLQALPHLDEQDKVLILCGDVPLISSTTLKQLIDTTPGNSIGLITAFLPNPYGYGRIKRNKDGEMVGIVEEKDANEHERAINEINTGIFYVSVKWLQEWLPSMSNDNAQQEYYLTQIIDMAIANNRSIHTIQPAYIEEVLGVNDRSQLAHLERFYQQQTMAALMKQGVTLLDPARVDIRGEVQIGRDVTIDVNVILEGNVVIGDGCIIGANCILKNTTLSEGVKVLANSILDGAVIGAHSCIGPFARIRPETIVEEHVHIGNFVEVKKSTIAKGSKANHLTYLGDCEIGSHVNVGAGTITCNYDGAHKHKTVIGNDVFIGSDTQLVAPVVVGDGATIGAGSTITRDVPPRELALSRVPQQTIKGWQRPQKDKV